MANANLLDANRSREVVTTLDNMLQYESGLYERYLAILGEERAQLHPLNSDKVLAFANERAELHLRMKEAEIKRLQYISSLAGVGVVQQIKLSQFVKDNFSPIDSKRLLLRVERLKDLVSKCHSNSREFGQVVNFSLNMVSGLVSIFWSATQNIVKSYTPFGNLQESYHPTRSRMTGYLRQA